MSKNRSGGIGFLGGLTLLFIGLKLASVIDWSWLWVLAPIWMPFSFIVLLSIIVVVVEEYDKRFGR